MPIPLSTYRKALKATDRRERQQILFSAWKVEGREDRINAYNERMAWRGSMENLGLLSLWAFRRAMRVGCAKI